MTSIISTACFRPSHNLINVFCQRTRRSCMQFATHSLPPRLAKLPLIMSPAAPTTTAPLQASADVQKSTQYSVLSDLITSETTSTSLEDVQDEFCKPVEDVATTAESKNKDDSLSEALTLSWKSVVSLAAETSFTDAGLSKLVDFVIELQSRPDIEIEGTPCKVQDQALWTDLPLFGQQMREAWNYAPSEDSDEAHQQRWINLNAWTASLVAAAHTQSEDRPDFLLYCIWTVRSALEESSEKVSETAVAAAAVWFIFAASTIRAAGIKERTFAAKLAAPGSAFADRSWRGFTADRWTTWTQALQSRQAHIKDNVTAQLVQQALDAIQKAEQ